MNSKVNANSLSHTKYQLNAIDTEDLRLLDKSIEYDTKRFISVMLDQGKIERPVWNRTDDYLLFEDNAPTSIT